MFNISKKLTNEELREFIKTELLSQKLTLEDYTELLWLNDKQHYEQRPVDINTFISDDYFLGSLYKDKDTKKSSYYPFWQTHLNNIYITPFEKSKFEVILLLPIGSGKTIAATTSLLYEIYKLLCLKDPNNYYAIDVGSPIVFCLFSASMSLAENVNWAKMESAFDKSPWFLEHTPLPNHKNRINKTNMVELTKNISIDLGSNSLHAIGKAVFGGVLDEANFQGHKIDQAKHSYEEIYSRMDSRFRQFGGLIPGILWLCSSPKDSSDFLLDRLEKSKGSNSVYTLKNIPRWEIDGHRHEYDKETFKVFVGDDFHEATIIEDDDDFEYDPDRIYNVPKRDYYSKFKRDLITQIRDTIGWSIGSSLTFFKKPNEIRKVMTLKNNFKSQIISLSYANKENNELLDCFNTEYLKNINDPPFYRFLHVDVGLTNDRLGIASAYCIPDYQSYCCNMNEYITNGGRNALYFKIKERFYFIDFMIAVEAKKNSEIPLSKVRDFIIYLKSNGYPIANVSTDKFEGRFFRQELETYSIPTSYISVDRERHPYLFLKDKILSKSILMPFHELLFQELRDLRDDGDKVDHPSDSSKDIADAVAGSVWNASLAENIVNISHLLKIVDERDTRFITKMRLEYEEKERANKIRNIYFNYNLNSIG